MKINNEDYTKGNIVDLLKSNSTTKTNFKTSFFDTLSKSTRKIEDSKANNVKNNNYSKKNEYSNKNDYSDKKFKDAVAINLNTVSNKGAKAISEFEKFLKSGPSEEEFNTIIESLTEILSENEVSLEDMDTSIDDSTLENIISLFANYTLHNVQPEHIPTLETSSLNEMPLDSSLDKSSVINEELSNAIIADDFGFGDINSTNIPEDIESLIDSAENEFSKLIESFGEKNVSLDESKDILKKILELSGEELNRDTETLDSVMKKEDISVNPNNLITGSISLDESNFKDNNVNVKSPIVHHVLESIHAQLCKESLNNKTVELRLKLFPSKLGSVSVVIEKDNGSLNIKILSDNPEVRSLFLDSLQDLKLELSKNNSADINIDISNGNQNNESNENKNKNNTSYTVNGDYIEDIAVKISTNNYIIDKILDIKI